MEAKHLPKPIRLSSMTVFELATVIKRYEARYVCVQNMRSPIQKRSMLLARIYTTACELTYTFSKFMHEA